MRSLVPPLWLATGVPRGDVWGLEAGHRKEHVGGVKGIDIYWEAGGGDRQEI